MAWYRPYSVSGDFARANAHVVAMAASSGYITTERLSGDYGRQWLITQRGHLFLLGVKPT